MKKIIFLFTFSCLLAVSFAQPNYVAPSGTSVITTKADSLMTVAAVKLGVDTNASAAEIGEQIDTAISFVPGKHAGYLAWLKFIMKLFIPIIAVYFFIKHQLVSAKLKSLTKVSAVLLLMLMLGLSSCGVTKVGVTPYGGTVTEQITKNGYYVQQRVAIHTAPFQNDTVAVTVYGPDSVTNPLLTKIKNFIDTELSKVAVTK